MRSTFVLLLLLVAAPAQAQDAACGASGDMRAWVQSLFAAWNGILPELVRQQPSTTNYQPPTLITFDAACVWQFDGTTGISGHAHDGTIQLPNGDQVPAALISFSSAVKETGKPFVVFSAPAIWKQQARFRDEHGEASIRAVFVHEMVHVLQTPAFGPSIGRLSAQLADPDSLTDDIVQDVFGDDAAFRAAWERERDLLFDAAAEDDRVQRQASIDEAIQAIESRRAQFFTGGRAFYREMEDLFLVMEGAANWAGYRSLVSAGIDEATAQTLMRGSRRNWSQDEGLALFLVLERQGSDWRRAVFGGGAPPSVPELLRR